MHWICTANPTITAAASQVIRKNEVGGVMGVIQGLGSLGQVLGLVMSGPFYELGGGVLTFGFGAVISLMLFIVIAMMIFRPRRRRLARA